MQHGNRKSSPQVVKGKVQKKNNWSLSPDYYHAPQPRLVVVDRKRPGVGYKHMLNKRDIYQFLELLPDWDNLAIGLNAIVLAPGEWDTDGYHVPGVVHICAWDADLWSETTQKHYEEHQDIFERLGVPCELREDYYLCKWEENTARAYQLVHILLHELGHHRDRMTTRSQKRACRGEPFAEEYARLHEAEIWEKFVRVFPL